ncbi:type II secretion system protein [Campylobacter jejuni]|uniref:Transformation system protein n=1 Tax=Campylobacter jejuni TaxID=197 RepID=A0A431ESN1_CAMJU|nr:type II secretion system protein [Campylobacter jejuni]MCW1368354.1 type II secretion system GspH family protein [Campylobacter jejuni]RTJ84242.1 transformation system protein [Campylobacter jejuni]RTJ97624.1 transformation system protein [Campylobacter jejuni]HEC1676055.1 type II secretion system protein [Campylobacter jejuni]HEC1692949.1 type II secretion system protein [Campylobacter jejuni]
MKKAFILIESISVITIISLIFIGIFYYYTQLYKNYENLNIFERLYKLQEELYEKPIFKTIILQTSALKPIVLQEQFVNDGIFQFQKLYFQDQNYSVYFKE